MLKNLPRVGQFVRALESDGEQYGERFQTAGEIYEIAGNAYNGNPYFIDDLNERTYIDENSLYVYELVEDSADAFTDALIKLIDERIDKKIKNMGEPVSVDMTASVEDALNIAEILMKKLGRRGMW